MIIKDRGIKYLMIVVFAVAAIAATIILDLPQLQYEPLLLWLQVAVPILLVAGFIGMINKSPYLRFAGWIGIFLFIICGIGFFAPSEDYVLGGGSVSLISPRIPQRSATEVRFFVWLIVSLSLIWCFWKVRPQRYGKQGHR